jgi:hypothetical protein
VSQIGGGIFSQLGGKDISTASRKGFERTAMPHQQISKILDRRQATESCT